MIKNYFHYDSVNLVMENVYNFRLQLPPVT